MPRPRNIQLTNLPDVDAIDRAKIDSALSATYDRLQKILNNKLMIKAHFKQPPETGKKQKYSVHLHLSTAGIDIMASDSGWELLAALQEAISTLERETIEKVKRALP